VPAFTFESITAAQAGAFSAAADTLSFNAATAPTPASVTVVYQGARVLVTVGDRTVDFGAGFVGSTTTFANGAKLVVGAAGAETILGTGGADHLLGGDGADVLSGLDGGDLLEGGPGNDSLSGGAGDDTLQGGTGVDTLDGGDGVDVVSFSTSSVGVQVSLGANTDGVDQVLDFEGLEGSAFADSLVGDARGNILRGGFGGDTLTGLDGDDSLEGGRGDDVVDGGAGSDTLVYLNPLSGVFVNLETNNATSFDTVLGQDTLVGIENAIATRFNDVLLGSGGANRFSGLEGNDSANGGRGTDTLEGGDGNDTLNGGEGSDWIIGGAGVDLLEAGADLDIIEFGAGDSPAMGLVTARDHVRGFGDDLLLFRGGVAPTAANYIEVDAGFTDPRTVAQDLYAQGYEYIAVQIGGNIEFFAPRLGVGFIMDNLSLNTISLINILNQAPAFFPNTAPSSADDLINGVGNDTIDGLAGADTIMEMSGTNYLRGGEGNDSIVGGSGFDDINGNMGDDTCVSGGGDDWVVGGKENDSLSGSAGNNLVYGNIGADTCEGGAGADTIRGGQDNDVLRGGDGADFVSGDKGTDTVSGGAGADIFHTFNDAGVDRVLDFSVAEGDRVQLDPGTQYTVSQSGADTIINMPGGGQMILVGVQMTTLQPGWIFGA
jgi:Ca2+-binding RTX toxin-like protein